MEGQHGDQIPEHATEGVLLQASEYEQMLPWDRRAAERKWAEEEERKRAQEERERVAFDDFQTYVQAIQNGVQPPIAAIAASEGMKPWHPPPEQEIPVAVNERKIHMLTSFGLLVLVLFSFVPTWNMVWLMRSSVYLYFANKGLPIALLMLVGMFSLWSLVPCYSVRLHREWGCCLPGTGCPAVTGCCLPSCPHLPPGCLTGCSSFGLLAWVSRPWSKRSRSELCFTLFLVCAVVYLVVYRALGLPNPSPVVRSSRHLPDIPGPQDFGVEFPERPNYFSGLPERVGWEQVAYFIPDSIRWFCIMSSTSPMILLVAMLGTLFAYVLTSSIFLAKTKPPTGEGKLVDVVGGLFTVWACYVLVLGLVLVLAALPILWESHTAQDDLFKFCESSDRTKDLFANSQGLQALRQLPACRKEASVETCSGYVETAYSAVLRFMERDLHCSGFCYRNSITMNPGHPAEKKLQLLDTPLTLFSQEDYEPSCDGMSARYMGVAVGNSIAQMYIEGIVLIVGTAALGIMKLSGIVPGQSAEAAVEGTDIIRPVDPEMKKVNRGYVATYGTAVPRFPEL